MSASNSEHTPSDPGSVLGFMLLRLWLAMRAIVTGIEKFAGTRASDTPVVVDGEPNDYGLVETATEKVYGFSQYHGVPESLYDRFQNEPLIPGFALKVFDLALGPLLLVLGLALLLGVATRSTLFAMGLLYTALTAGLVLLGQDGGIAWLGIHVLLIAVALTQVRHNRWELFKKW